MTKRAKSAKLKAAKAHQRLTKRRAKYRKVLERYRGDRSWGDLNEEHFNSMVAELSSLHVKLLAQLLEDIPPGFYGINRKLLRAVEGIILERTLLK